MPNHILLSHLNQFLRDQQFIWHITANFNRPTTYAAGRDKIKTWASFVDRKLHGRLYYRKPIEQRLFFVAVPEFGACGDNLHYHLLAKVPDESMIRFKPVAEGNADQLTLPIETARFLGLNSKKSVFFMAKMVASG